MNKHQIDAFLLTGGGDLLDLGGNDKAREEVEEYLIKISQENNTPLLGVCRGMQKIQSYFGIELKKINNHVTLKQKININGITQTVNSYHNFGTTKNTPEFKVWAEANDGIIKAIKHVQHRINGIMWHPERMQPFRKQDIEYFRTFYK